MELMTKLKDIIPWKRKSVETQDVMSLRDDINQLFDRFLLSPFDSRFGHVGHGIDMDETEEGVIIRAEVPGLDPKRLDVQVRSGVLQIGYEQEHEWRDNGQGSGRRYAAFHKTVALPEGVDTSKAEAACKHGLLIVRIPWNEDAKEGARRVVVSVE
jgi:HSP20 family protein